MEDLKWLFYILLAVIILVVRMWLKAFQSPKPSTIHRPAAPKAYPVPAPPATSYQDILKEMKASGERAKKIIDQPLLETAKTSEKIRREAKSLEKTESQARSLEKVNFNTREIVRKPSTIEMARQSKPRSTVSHPPQANYGKLLQDPQNMRAAFILSEILIRRVDY